MESNMNPFAPASFYGSLQGNGIPVFNQQLPITVGGLMGDVEDDAPPKFGRLVSIDPSAPDVFVMGNPADTYPVGILIQDPAIQQNEPGANDVYIPGRPATAAIMGSLQFGTWDTTATGSSGKPGVNQQVVANKTTGEIGFIPKGTAVPATHLLLNAAVIAKEGPNGVTVFFNSPLATIATSEGIPTLPAAILTIPGGTVPEDTLVDLTNAYLTENPGAKLEWLFGTETTYKQTPMVIDADGTYKVRAYGSGYTTSGVTSYDFTLLT